jgi:DNA polymerase-3 subunit alpha
MSDFVHLHVHSEYSLLDGLPHPKQLAARAAELQQPALALTDHGALFAAIEFYDACQANEIKPIIGVEAYLAKRAMKDRDAKEDRKSYHLLLLAENNAGYQNLLKLASAAELEGFYYDPRMDRQLLEKYSAGIIATTGCPSAEIPRFLQDGRREEARRALAWYREVFKDRCYVELQEHGIADMANVNKELIALAREFDLPLVATNDAHYLRPEDASAQDILLCIQTNTVITDPKRMRMDGTDYFLKSSDEMRAVWRELPEAISNTLLIAERCNVDLDFKEYHLPHFPVPEGFTAESYLRHLCEEGFARIYLRGNPEARARLDYELAMIHQMGFNTYFLIVWDLCRAAREKDIWYNVRGSAAASMAAYCCGMTLLDPLKHGLIFERFLNPGRVSMPDIDLDFQDDRRGELIEYTVQKYGRDNVAQIITFGTLGAKAAIRDVGRALDYPLSEVDRVAKLLPTGPNVKLGESLEKIPEFKEVYETNDYLHKLIDTARLLEGVARNAGTHAAGVVVADKPLVEYVPLHRPTKGNESGGFPITQFEMTMFERVGLLKMDYLGLATLTIMRRACDLIRARHGKEFDLSNIPAEDPKAFELLARGDVAGVFQVESAGMRKVLMQMKPSKFEHIVATVSLYRPGPMDYIPTYINRMHGLEKVKYDHPKLEPILAETYAICVYQEQIIRMAMDLAGYSAPDADLLRVAVAKKYKDKLLKERVRFVEGCQSVSGMPQATAEKLFDDLESFARYGFNKAHSADYGVLTCQTAYLKAYYPIEYMTALLTTETGNVEKVGQMVSETRRMGIDILPPDVNTSDADFAIAANNHAIHFGLKAIKNVGAAPVDVILRARASGGPFKSLDDFCRRVDLRQVNRRVLESLIRAGALDRFGRRSQLLKVLDRVMAASQAAHQASDRGQLSMFGTDPSPTSRGGGLGWGLTADTFGTLPDEPELPNREKLANEKELTGAYFSDNPLLRLAKASSKNITHLVNQIDEALAGQMVALAGVVTSARVITTKKGDLMAFVQLEDPSGTIEITVFPRTYARTEELWRTDSLVQMKGRVELREGKVQVLCESASEYQVPTDDDRSPTADNRPLTADGRPPTTDGSRLSVVGSQPSVVQFAMPDDSEAAVADVSALVEEAQMLDDDAFADMPPPPPDEPPSDLVAPESRLQTTDHRPQITDYTQQTADRPAPMAEHAREIAESKPMYATRAHDVAAPYNGTRHLRIFLARTNDQDEDVRRMRELFALLTSTPGQDRFTFFVPNPQGTVQLDFPNHTTSFVALQEPLTRMVGEWGTLEVQ